MVIRVIIPMTIVFERRITMEKSCWRCGNDLYGARVCPVCGATSQEDRVDISGLKPQGEGELSQSEQMQKMIYNRVNDCESHLRSIKNMLIFYTVLIIIGMIISLVTSIIA